ncbi:MAG: 1-(5-phosphoribosyl)-5-[(5-phosphoribosylamino)methylideneamino]imidazole-4-carboxamide isomerase [Gammaproteobacteria bacterium]|nr:1-(5-phosphoribosyl)-5-[(5-phosphoribosylamino)methylideneamino]imidazole-4-carboxamide isomerase [Gammaproteobacteria bacterium]
MLVIPAIDLKDGKCVRLRQGRMDDDTVYSDDPVTMAGKWIDAGARRLHLVDLNGAFAGKPKNGDVIRRITKTFPDVPIQVGGGIREENTVQAYLDAGVSYAIIGTKAVQTPEFVSKLCSTFPGHIMVGLDAKEGKVAIDGWANVSAHNIIDMAKCFEQDGVEAIIYTDISRDGMQTGVNIESTVALAESVNIPVIASGGITNLDDIRSLCAVEPSGIIGAITGRAIYEGSLDFSEAQKLADELTHETRI